MIEQELAEIVCLLVDVPNLVVTSEHKKIIRRLIEQYPTVDVKAVMEKWVAGTADKPLDKKSRPGSQWVTWVKLAKERNWERRKVSADVMAKPQQSSKWGLIHYGGAR